MKMERYRPYSEYKDSGVEWFGEIPVGWEVKRLKEVAAIQMSNVDKKSVEGEQPVELCNYTDVYYHDRISSEMEFMQATAPREQVRKFTLREGDVLITKDSESWTDIAVPAVVAEDLPNVLCGYHLAHIRPGTAVYGPYLARAIGAVGPRDQFRVSANGVTRFAIGTDAIATSVFALPTIAEQRAIAAFLDRETARIDALVLKKERLITLLHERRTALITRAVTKGLNPAAPMKNSGVEWLGEIPAHWEVKRLKHLALSSESGIQMGPFGSMLKDLVERDTGYRVYGQENTISGDFARGGRWITSHQYEELSDYRLREGDIVLTRKGSLGNGRILPRSFVPGIIDSDTIRVRVDREVINADYLVLLLHEAKYVNEQIGAARRGAVLGGLNTATISNLLIAAPAPTEQAALMKWVRLRSSQIDRLISRIRAATTCLHELRTALISAAVTGKIDVREATR